MPGDVLGGPPPNPGLTAGSANGGPSFRSLAGPGPQQQQPQPNTAGGAQIGGAAVRMASEIDLALKTLAQSIPALGPWVEQTCQQLRQQIGQAINNGAVPTNASPAGAQSMPDGGQNL